MFWLRKLAAACTDPLILGLAAATGGLVLLWIGRRTRSGRALISIGLLVLLLAGYGWPFRPLVQRLENRHPPFEAKRLPVQTRSAIRTVVVLGGGHSSEPRLSALARLGNSSLKRLTEGIRVLRQFPRAHLMLSGGPGFETVSNARLVAEAAQELGVPADRIRIEERPATTADEARLLQPVLAGRPFVLVTSASHMPRSMAAFRSRGLTPLAAPTDYLVRSGASREPGRLLPSVDGLRIAQTWVYEQLGTLWYRLQGTIHDHRSGPSSMIAGPTAKNTP